jgi:hypothetical protein
MPINDLYIDMIQLFNSLIVPLPQDAKVLCNTGQGVTTNQGVSGTLVYYNWGYAQINALVLTGGQKYNVQLQNPGYIVMSLGNYTINLNLNAMGSTDFYYDTFNLNDYNNYINNTKVSNYSINYVSFNQLALAYGYVDSNGFTLDLTELSPSYALILGLVKFDYVNQVTTYTVNYPNGESFTSYIYGMSTALNTVYLANGINNVTINFPSFLGIPFNTTVEFNQYTQPAGLIGYQLNDGFLVNDETVSNNAFNFPTDLGNVTAVPTNTGALINPNSSPPPYPGLLQFGSPQNTQYYTVVNYSSGSPTFIEATGSSPSPGLPNTNTIIANHLSFGLPYVGSSFLTFKSIYNNNGFNDVWVLSNSTTAECNIVYPPFFNPFNTNNAVLYLQLNSSSPDIIYQYIAQAPVVQISTTSTSTTSSSVTTTQSSTSTTPSTTQTITTPTTQSQTTTSSTSSTTVTNVTQQIVTALANPIVALILALALVGVALFVLV